MDLEQLIPFWKELTPEQQALIKNNAQWRTAPKGTVLHRGEDDCLGLVIIASGLLRAYIVSDEGKEVTLYRLFERDMCLFSASCMMRDIQFDIHIEVEKEARFWVIPAPVYQELMDTSLPVLKYTNSLMATRFSDVMWLIEQIIWKSFDKRLAGFLLTEQDVEGSSQLTITHDRIASHLGTAREVVTRMLRYFQSEELVKLSRGSITIVNAQGLEELSQS